MASDGKAVFLDDPRAGEKFFSLYGASKAAQIALARSWAAETERTLRDQLAALQADTAETKAQLDAARAELSAVQATASETAEDRASVEERLLAALDSLERAQAAASANET